MPGESQQTPKSEPDPSVLTTQQLDRAIKDERDWVLAKLDVLVERLIGMDKAAVLLSDTVNRVPTDVQKGMEQVREIIDEKFKSVDQRFQERDTRSERESRDNKVAVDAAFAAQKEAASEQNKSNTLAIDKSEKATAETLNKQADLFKSTTDALTGRISDEKERNAGEIADLKERIGKQESIKTGVIEERATNQQNNNAMYALVGLIITIILATISIIGFLSTSGGT